MAENKINIAVESFEISKEALNSNDNVIIQGFALPFDKTSRNGFAYRKESIIKTAKTLEGKKMFFNHNTEAMPIGKIRNVNLTDKGLEYVAELDKDETTLISKVRKGLIENVSIQCIYENARLNESTNTFEVDVKEFLELSLVTIPGFADTTANAVEKLMKDSEIKKQMENIKANIKKEEVELPAVTEPVEEPNKVDDAVVQLQAQVTELSTRLVIVESRLDAMEKADETEVGEVEQPQEVQPMETIESAKAKEEEAGDKTAEEPFADYKSFEDCVAQNQGKDNPQAYCSVIKKKAEESKKTQNVPVITRATVQSSVQENVGFDYVEFRKNRLKSFK